MAYITQPINSEVRLSPFSQRLLQYGIEDSRLYLSKATNSLLIPYTRGYRDKFHPDNFTGSENKLGHVGAGEFTGSKTKISYYDRKDCILDGLLNDLTIENGVAIVKVQPGQCIVDNTILVFPFETELDIPLDQLNFSGDTVRLILSVNYQWMEVLYEQPPLLKLTLIDINDSLNYGPDSWELRNDRLVISYFDINVTNNQFINYNPEPCYKFTTDYIEIKNTIYEVGPPIAFLRNFREYSENTYTKKLITWTKPCIDPEGLLENQIDLPLEYIADPSSPIIGILFDINYNPNEVFKPRFYPNKDLALYNKTLDFYVDLNTQGEETGLIRIQVGEGAIVPRLLPTMPIGTLRFDFNKAIEGTNISIVPSIVTGTFNNGTTTNINFQPRIYPVEKSIDFPPLLQYNFQPANVNFGHVELEDNMHLYFEMNGVSQHILLDSTIVNKLKTQPKIEQIITPDLKLYLNSNNELILEALNDRIFFTDCLIYNDLKTHKKLYFKETTDPTSEDWIISNQEYCWEPTDYDVLNISFNTNGSFDHYSFILTPKDIQFLKSNIGLFVQIPSVKLKVFDVKYDIINSKSELTIKISDAYKGTGPGKYEITNAVLTMKDGSGISDRLPLVKDYRSAEQIYDLTEIGISGNKETGIDKLIYTLKSDPTDTKILEFDEDIIKVLKNSVYGYREQGIYLTIDSITNRLHIKPIEYNDDFVNTLFKDCWIDENYPSIAPSVWMMTDFISTKPVGNDDFVEDPNLVYSTNWTVGDLNDQTSGERDFYTVVDISKFRTKDVTIQVQKNNFVVNPMGIEILPDEEIVKIWMPESFVFEKPMAQLKIIAIG